MNIKQVKEELRHTIQAYTKKNEFGEYEIPFVRQRPMLIIGPPGIGKTAIMSQVARECHVALVSYDHASHGAECHRPAFYREEELRRPGVQYHGIYDE